MERRERDLTAHRIELNQHFISKVEYLMECRERVLEALQELIGKRVI